MGRPEPLAFVILLLGLLGSGCIGNKAETDNTHHLLSGEEKRYGLNQYRLRTNFRNSEARKLNDRAVKLARNGNNADAHQIFLKALSLEPENAIVLTHLGNIAYASGNLNEAIGFYNRSHIVSDSLHLNAGVHLGRSYYLNGEYGKCIIISKYTLSQTDDEKTYYLSYYNMTKAFIKKGDCESAQKSFRHAKQMIGKYDSFRKRIYALRHELENCAGK